MEILVKTNRGLKSLGEGRVYSKKQLMLKEDGLDANLGMSSSIQAAQMKAKQMMSKNPTVTSASADAGKLDGQMDSQNGEGVRLELPVNANGKQLAQAQKMVSDTNADDAQITFTKNQDSMTTESRLSELRANSVPFSKNELDEMFNGII